MSGNKAIKPMQYAIKITTVKIKYIIFQLSHLLVICRIMNFMSYVLEGKCKRVNSTIFFINSLKNIIFTNYCNGSLTQLVQSVTSTTWKSLVRIQYGPHTETLS